MKLLDVKFVDNDEGFTKVSVEVLNENGDRVKGFWLFETDGRDFEVEEMDYDYVTAHLDDVYTDEVMLLRLEEELAKGQVNL